MTIESAREHLERHGADDRIVFPGGSTATVELAAAGLGVEPGQIAKTLALKLKGENRALLVVAKGTARLDNAKFKKRFDAKASFVTAEECLDVTGHPPGGVCPFGQKDGIAVYLDESLKSFAVVYPAAGSPDNCVRATPEELEQWTGGEWVDVCR